MLADGSAGVPQIPFPLCVPKFGNFGDMNHAGAPRNFNPVNRGLFLPPSGFSAVPRCRLCQAARIGPARRQYPRPRTSPATGLPQTRGVSERWNAYPEACGILRRSHIVDNPNARTYENFPGIMCSQESFISVFPQPQPGGGLISKGGSCLFLWLHQHHPG
jgi:hypothetical protein